MSTFTITQPTTQTLTDKFDTFYDLYLYLIENIIDIDVQEHSINDFSSNTQKKITTIDERSFSSFINI